MANISHPAVAAFIAKSNYNQTPGPAIFAPRRTHTGGGSAASDNYVSGAVPNQQVGVKVGANIGNVAQTDVSAQLSAAFIGLMVVGIAAFYYVTRHMQL